MADKEYFFGKLLTSEDLRARFMKDPKSTLDREGLSLEDVDQLDVKVVIEPSDPGAAGGTTICSETCTTICSGGVGTTSGSKTGTVIDLKAPTAPGG